MSFKKLRMLLLVVVLFGGLSGVAHARLSGGGNIMQSAVSITSYTTATSDYIDLTEGEYFGIWYKTTHTAPGASVDVKLEILMSYDTTAGNFVEPEGMSDIVTNLTDAVAHVESLSLPPMRYLKIKATGNADTSSNTVITTVLFLQNSK